MSGIQPSKLFTCQTLDAVRSAVDQAGVFFVCGEINLWRDFVGPTYDSFVAAQRDLCVRLLLQRRKQYECHYIECNKLNRLARNEQSTKGTGVGSDSVSSKEESKKKNKKSSTIEDHRSKTSSSKPKNSRNPVDPDVVQRISEPFKK